MISQGSISFIDSSWSGFFDGLSGLWVGSGLFSSCCSAASGLLPRG